MSIIYLIGYGETVPHIARLGNIRSTTRCLALGVAVFLLASAALLVWAMYGVHAQAEDTECQSNLKQLGLQLLTFADRYGCLPPPHISDMTGKPLYSWRVLILPSYVGHDEAYDAFDFTKSWDDPANMALCEGKHDVFLGRLFSCPSIRRSKRIQADYFYALNAKDRWPADFFYDANPRAFPPHVLVVESQARSVYWSEPVDLVYQEAEVNGLLMKITESRTAHDSGFNCFLSDGSVKTLPPNRHPVDDLRDIPIAARRPRIDEQQVARDIDRLIVKLTDIVAKREEPEAFYSRHIALLLLAELGPQAKAAAEMIRRIAAEEQDARLTRVAVFALAKIER